MHLLIKLLGTGMGLGAGIVASKLVDFLWEKITGEASPKGTEGLENTVRSALAFALISGAIRTTIQVFTNRGMQKAIERFEKTRDLT
jgi:hypothetical protein